jgi:hypothetical protein
VMARCAKSGSEDDVSSKMAPCPSLTQMYVLKFSFLSFVAFIKFFF